MSEIANKLKKGDYAIAHIQSSGYSLLAGNFHYSRFYVVEIVKASREGIAKSFLKYPGASARPVDRKVTIYSGANGFDAETLAATFAKQEVCFVGYYDTKELKAALSANVKG